MGGYILLLFSGKQKTLTPGITFLGLGDMSGKTEKSQK